MREASSLVLGGAAAGRGRDGRRLRPGRRATRRGELLPSVELCGSAEEALEGADAAVLVTEWPEFAELDWAALARADGATRWSIDGRNFLDPETLRAAGFAYEGIGRPNGGGGPERRDRRRPRGSAALMQALVLVGGEGTRLRPLTLTAEAGAAAGRPAVHPLHGRLARPPRGRRGGDGLRLRRRRRCARRSATGDGRGPRIRYVEEPEPLGTAGPDAPRRRRGAARRPLPGPERRRAHRPRPERADPRPRGARGGGHAGALPGRGPDLLRPGRAPGADGPGAPGERRRRGARVPREAGRRPRSTPTRSTPAPTCSSAACST